MSTVARLWLIFIAVTVFSTVVFLVLPDNTSARNIQKYKDTITDSAPGAYSNHTFEFQVDTYVAPGGRLEFTFPSGFSIISTSTFDVRNVELLVNGFPRIASTSASAGIDQVDITTGDPGFIRYTLAPDFSISDGSSIELRVGNRTSGANYFSETYDATTTSTTTIYADVEPIRNTATVGTQQIRFEIWDAGVRTADAGFVISINSRVSILNLDTTEKVPPYRFNPAPTSSVGGTTLSVEISIETDEFSFCRYSKTPGVAYGSMTLNFTNSGLIFHSTVVTVTANSVQHFYIRCIDDEGNFNTDDFDLTFRVDEKPTGTANTEGSTSGNGTGSGNSGTGNGSGGGGTTGGSSGQTPSNGGTAGTGGSGGGGGGGRGPNNGSTAGGGFETSDEAYRSGDARVIISGYAFPNSTVTVLVDGTIAQTVRSSGSGTYSVTLDAIARGVYTFGVYAEGSDKVKSSTFSTSFTVTGARTSELTNINVSPSIKVTPDPVQPGQSLAVTGYALPNSTVTLQNGRLNVKQSNKEYTAIADAAGRWSTTIDTAGFTKGTYQIRAKSVQEGGSVTNYSSYTFYGVGESANTPLNADLNRDGKVNLTDFSILLFWWGTAGGDSNPPADINHDSKVSLTDFSILLFNWTG